VTAPVESVAVVTGGASGIGKALATAFRDDGMRIVIGDRDVERLDATVAGLDSDAVAGVVLDVTDETSVEAFVAVAVERFGRLDVAVNSAGVGWLSPIVDHTLDDWNTVVDICLTGTFLSIKHEARAIRAGGDGGVIVNLASLNATQPAEGMAPYCAAKAGVEMLTRVAAMELGGDAIRVVGIAPGVIETPLTELLVGHEPARDAFVHNTPIARVGTTTDIVAAARFLASDDASWVSGETLYVDGGARTREYPRLLGLFGVGDSSPQPT